MKNNRELLDQAMMTADLCAEPMPGQSFLELVGDRRLIIEKHMGVIGYGEREITVKTRFGRLLIYGTDLSLIKMTKQQLVIFGRIESICVCRGVT